MSADVVLYGTIVDFESRRIFGKVPDDYVLYARTTIDTSEVLLGATPSDQWTLEFMVNGEDVEDGVERLNDKVPLLPTLYFLRAKSDSEEAGTTYYRLVNSRAALVNRGGTVGTPSGAEDEFLRALEGSDFEDALERVRAATHGPAADESGASILLRGGGASDGGHGPTCPIW